MINLIWAMTKDHLIGKDNKIPWHIKEDLLYYKEKTNNQVVLMGENTYYSLKGYYKKRPLPYKKIYVASLNELKLEDAIIINDVEIFLKNNNEDLFVVGGATIYKLALPYANRLYISIVKGNYEGDAYFPNFDLSLYQLVSKKESVEVDYLVYERI